MGVYIYMSHIYIYKHMIARACMRISTHIYLAMYIYIYMEASFPL